MVRSLAILALLVSSFSMVAATKPQQLPPRFKTWLTQDVVYIITEEERKNFLALPTDEARDQFIEQFWDIRNPLRSKSQNPYKEEHYKRIEYVNGHFGRQSNTLGWMTDMGRAYILFGPPTSRHPFIGYGQIYPLELWFYENNTGTPSLPPFFTLLFYIPEDVGEYKFYRPGFDGPLKLVRGSNFRTNRDVYNFLKPLGGDLAHAALSLVPNDPIDTTDFNPDMSSDMLVNKILNFANDTFNVRKIRELRSLREKVSSYLLVAQQKALEIESIVLSDPLGQYWLDYSVLIDDPALGTPNPATGELKLSISYRLSTDKGELIAEDAEDSAYPAFDKASAERKFQPFQVGNRLPLVPGDYKLEVQVVNRAGGKTYRGETKIKAGPGNEVSLTGPLLANSVDRVARPDAATPFQYFGVQFHPAVGRRLARRDPVRLLFELQQAAGSEPREYQVEYVLAEMHDRTMRRTLNDAIAPESFKNGRLMMSKTIPLSELETGDYRLVVNVKAAGAPQVLTSVNVPIKLGDAENESPLYFLANSKNMAARGVAPYVRALESVAQKNDGAAKDYLKQALDQNPANAFAGQYLVQLYFNGRNFEPVTALYKRLGITPFKASPETLAQISVSFWRTGDRTQAREVLQTAQSYFPKNPLLEATALNLK